MVATLLLLLAPADVPGIWEAVVEPVYDLALLSHREAQRLDGRRVRFRVDLEYEPGEADNGAIVYDCVSIDAANRTVWLGPGEGGQGGEGHGGGGGVARLWAPAEPGNRGVLGLSSGRDLAAVGISRRSGRGHSAKRRRRPPPSPEEGPKQQRPTPRH